MSTHSSPLVVHITNSLPPYRVRVHKRILHEVPEVRTFTVTTHDPRDGVWPAVSQDELPHISFGPGEPTRYMFDRRYALHEWRKAGRIIRWLSRQKPAAVIINGYADAGRMRIIAWCRTRGIPIFCHADSNVLADRRSGVHGLIKRAIVGAVVRMCFGVMPFGSLGAAYFRRYGARPDRIFMMPCEPDYDRIAALGGAEIAIARSKFGFDPQRKHVLFCGRLAHDKRVDLAIRAFIAIAVERPEWDLVITGDGPLRDSLRAMAPAELNSRIIWTGNVTDPSTVYAIFKGCHVMVLPSDYEPWALVVNEANAAGLAIVCSNVVGASAELVREGVNGRLFPRGDADALATALRDVTAGENLQRMRDASPRVLAEWRQRGDPVTGFRHAMSAAGVI